jgi:hypothetical protein
MTIKQTNRLTSSDTSDILRFIMPPLNIVAGLFAFSLLAAVVLFRFLKSTALIKNKDYQAGGSIAGFIIVYGMLHWSYTQTAGYTQTIAAQKATIDQQNQTLAKLKKFTDELTVSGTVSPITDDTLVMISAWESPADSSGTFNVKAPCLLGSDQAQLVIIQQGHYYMKYITPGGSPVNVQLH